MCYFERILNIQPPFVVSVAVLMINIHKYKSRACSDFISDETPHTNKGRFYRYKVTANDV